METIKQSFLIVALIGSFFAIPKVFAQNRIDSIRMGIAAAADDSTRVYRMIDLSRALNRGGSGSEEALDVATEAMQLAARQDSFTYSQSINNLGLLLRYHQQFEESLALHIRAYKMIARSEERRVGKECRSRWS